MKLFSSFLAASPPGDPQVRALLDAPVRAPDRPWRGIDPLEIDALEAIGFARASETLLICSHHAQWVIDASDGGQLHHHSGAHGLDVRALKGTRLDHPADERFDMAGRCGGALRSLTDDGWSVEVIGSGDLAHCLLHPPKGKPATDGESAVVLARTAEPIRAFGFSWSGQTLALATPSRVQLWSRPAPLPLR